MERDEHNLDDLSWDVLSQVALLRDGVAEPRGLVSRCPEDHVVILVGSVLGAIQQLTPPLALPQNVKSDNGTDTVGLVPGEIVQEPLEPCADLTRRGGFHSAHA